MGISLKLLFAKSTEQYFVIMHVSDKPQDVMRVGHLEFAVLQRSLKSYFQTKQSVYKNKLFLGQAY